MLALTKNKDLKFHDISAETWREYKYPDGTKVRIERPAAVAFSDKHRAFGGNGHRIVDLDATAHYIPAGWVHLTWQVKENEYLYSF